MKKLIYMLFFLSFHTVLGQIMPTNYFEILIDDKQGDDYKIINLNENGILTILESQDVLKGGNQQLIISHFDTLFNPIWQVKPIIKNEYKIKNYYREKENLYFLVEKKLTEYEIMELNLINGDIKIFKMEDIIPLEVAYFKVFNKIIFLAGEVEGRPAVLWFDYLNAKNPKVLPQINTLKADVRSITYSLDGESVSVLLTTIRGGKSTIFIQNYSLDGHLLNKVEIKPDKAYNLLSFYPYVSNENQQIIIGTYSNKNSDLAQGFYVAKFEDLEQKTIKFYDLGQLKNYFNYLSPKQKERLYEKINKKEEQGKVKAHDCHILLNELVEQGDKLLLSGDSYTVLTIQNSSYGTQNGTLNPLLFQPSWTRNSWNMPTQQAKSYNNLVYNYKNAITLAFDKQGNLLWDNAFEYDDIESKELTSHSVSAIIADSMTTVSTKDKEFYYKKTANNITIETIDKVKMDTIFGSAKLSEEPKPKLIAWYNNYFLAYGSQTMKSFDVEKRTKAKEIFYLSKFYCRKKPVKKQ